MDKKTLNTPLVSIPIIYELDPDAIQIPPSLPKSNTVFTSIIQPRCQQIVKIPVTFSNGQGIFPYTKFNRGVESPRSLVNVINNFAITCITNSLETPVKLEFIKPLTIEKFDPIEINVTTKLGTDTDLDNITTDPNTDHILKENLKRTRLDHCNDEEREAIEKICYEYRDIFYCEGMPLTFTNKIKHKIKLKDDTPIHTKTYRYPEVHKEEVQRQISQLLEQGIIEPSNSPYSSPVWIVPKKADASGKKVEACHRL